MERSLSGVADAAVCGRYMLDHVVGRGGMGVVYRAHDLKHGRTVALKIVPTERLSPEGLTSFQREIRLTARLQHPHILPLLDSGTFEGGPYYVTPFVEEGSLRDKLEREGPLSVQTAVRILSEVGGAIEYAHRNRVIHCDLKPENILISGRHAIVADFGISRALSEDAVGVPASTPGYGSPEQMLGYGLVDERTDVYSLGAVAFEMLTGTTPFAADADPMLLPRTMRGVLSKATAAQEDQRFGTVERFVSAFERAAGYASEEPLLPRMWNRMRAGARLARRRTRTATAAMDRASFGPASARTI